MQTEVHVRYIHLLLFKNILFCQTSKSLALMKDFVFLYREVEELLREAHSRASQSVTSLFCTFSFTFRPA